MSRGQLMKELEERHREMERQRRAKLSEQRKEFISNIDKLNKKELLKTLCIMLFDFTVMKGE